MAEAAMQIANGSSGAIWGFSILLKDTSTCSRGSQGVEQVTFRLLDNPRYLPRFWHAYIQD